MRLRPDQHWSRSISSIFSMSSVRSGAGETGKQTNRRNRRNQEKAVASQQHKSRITLSSNSKQQKQINQAATASKQQQSGNSLFPPHQKRTEHLRPSSCAVSGATAIRPTRCLPNFDFCFCDGGRGRQVQDCLVVQPCHTAQTGAESSVSAHTMVVSSPRPYSVHPSF